jgi:hypothetical protein
MADPVSWGSTDAAKATGLVNVTNYDDDTVIADADFQTGQTNAFVYARGRYLKGSALTTGKGAIACRGGWLKI